MVLVQYADNWADEMDLVSLAVMTEAGWESYREALAAAEYPVEIYFGTNESTEYGSAVALLGKFKVTPVQSEDDAYFGALLKASNVGVWIDSILEQVTEER